MNKTILYIAPNLSTFIVSDIKMLETTYPVYVNTYDWKKKYLVPLFLIHQFFVLSYRIWTAKAIIISFGGYWALLPSLFSRIFKVPSFIILNGTDCASIPSIRYGSLRSEMIRKICQISYNNVSLLLPVSESLKLTRNNFSSNINDDEYIQGYSRFLPNVKTPEFVIYNGFDFNFWKHDGSSKDENSFVSVLSNVHFFLKGGDLIIQIAKKYPEYKFYIAGCRKPKKYEDISNVIFLGYLKPELLKSYFVKSRYYFQLSIFEGFGCSLAEAMLCECIPIGSSVNIIPSIISNENLIVKRRNIDELDKTMQYAISQPNKCEIGKNGRMHIIENYSSELRKSKLLEVVEKY